MSEEKLESHKPEAKPHKPESKDAIFSKPVDISSLNAAPAAAPNPASIMSAPREKKKLPASIILIAVLILSAAANIALLISFVSKNDQIKTLESELSDERAYVDELKNKLNGGN